MEEPCIICQKPAEVTCVCDYSLRLCFRDFSLKHIKTNGPHECIDLEEARNSFDQRFKSFVDHSNNIKKEILSKSGQLIRIIKLITKSKLSIISNNIHSCQKNLKKAEFNIENFFKDYESIQTQEGSFELFVNIVNSNLSLYKNKAEVIGFDQDLENFLTAIKNQSENIVKIKEKHLELKVLELLNQPKELKRELKSEFNFYLKGHSFQVNSVAITKDSKYVISTGEGKKILVWNFFEKRLEIVFKGHSGLVRSVAVTNDSKYLISAGEDKTIRI